jgi:hypothetical protein
MPREKLVVSPGYSFVVKDAGVFHISAYFEKYLEPRILMASTFKTHLRSSRKIRVIWANGDISVKFFLALQLINTYTIFSTIDKDRSQCKSHADKFHNRPTASAWSLL